MSKLPSIFHNSGKYITNNKRVVNNKENKVNSNVSLDKKSLINYFNKKIIIELKTGKTVSGVLLSKRNNKILLDNNEYIDIDDILSIK